MYVLKHLNLFTTQSIKKQLIAKAGGRQYAALCETSLKNLVWRPQQQFFERRINKLKQLTCSMSIPSNNII